MPSRIHSEEGEFRVFNQFEETYSISELAQKVRKVAEEDFGLNVEIRNVENPRTEMEEHYYYPDHQHLLDLDYQPTHDMEGELRIMLTDLVKCKERIIARSHALMPDIGWDGRRKKVDYLK